jgi:hypothetical protein
MVSHPFWEGANLHKQQRASGKKKEKTTVTIAIPKMTQPDSALRLLAQMYARLGSRDTTHQEPYIQIRDVLYRARSQQEAHEQLTRLVEEMPDTYDQFPAQAYLLACESLEEVIQAGGSAETLMVGQTDGFRHLCLVCSQDEENFQRVRFFNGWDRRPLLKPECSGVPRSAYGRCQICQQPINPLRWVLFVFAGTDRHSKACNCGECNRAGIATLLTIYDCDRETHAVRLPHLTHIAAPSKTQCIERAIGLCWEQGWCMLNKESVLPR